MQVSDEDRQEHQKRRPKPGLALLVVAFLLVAGAIYLLYTGTRDKEEQVEETQAVTESAPVPELPPAPDIPQVEVAPEPEEPPFELPALEASDGPLRERLAPLGSEEPIELWLQKDNLVQRTTALIDGLSKGIVRRKLLPTADLPGKFMVVKSGDDLWMDKASYQRYDTYTEIFVNLDSELLSQNFHLFRPLLEQAYGELGNDPAQVDNALIRAIDLMLATPEPREPIPLVRESVYYKFADPALEKLPALQKQLLRMGPDNRRKVKDKLQAIRRELISKAGALDPMSS